MIPSIRPAALGLLLAYSLVASAASELDLNAPCEGRASFDPENATATFPLVYSDLGSYSATLAQLNPSTLEFQATQVAEATPAADGLRCHAQLFFGESGMSAYLPVVDVGGTPYRATLVQQSSGAFTVTEAEPIVLGRLEPLAGVYFGVNHDWSERSVAQVSSDFGLTPDVFVYFTSFPMSEAQAQWLDEAVVQVAAAGRKLVLTLEPHDGLGVVTAEAAEQLAAQLADYNEVMGVPIFLRFAHEMNGSWYAWSQQPAEYVYAFRLVADAVHRLAPQTAMLWAPNYGGGYPFSGGVYEAKAGTTQFALLDTNDDGVVNQYDDPYAPYYPGDDAVDWVGMSLYHWGNQWPWGENELPENGKFVALLTGTYLGADGDQTMLPNFYDDYANTHGKPLAIVETAALFVPGTGTQALGNEMKRQWWTQVFEREYRLRFPHLKMINWFDWTKEESEIGNQVVDWAVGGHEALTASFRQALEEGQVGIGF